MKVGSGAVALIQPLAWELPNAASAAIMSKEKGAGGQHEYIVPTPQQGNQQLGLQASVLFT